MNFWAISSFTPIFWCVCAARYLGIKSPIPYTWKDYAGKERLLYGMNYAYGGTGVFKTKDNPLPNMTTQIDYFQRILAAGNIYSPSDLPSSLALVSVAGNDYATFMALKRPVTVSKHHIFLCALPFSNENICTCKIKTICLYQNPKLYLTGVTGVHEASRWSNWGKRETHPQVRSEEDSDYFNAATRMPP